VRELLLNRAANLSTSIRIVAGRAYELNNSFPYLCSLGVDEEAMWRRMLAAFALTAMVPGICYLYLPAIFGWMPEDRVQGFRSNRSDPRFLNRVAVSREHYRHTLISPYGIRMQNLLRRLVRLRCRFRLHRPLTGDTICEVEPGVLEIRRGNDDVIGIFNFRLQDRVSAMHTPQGRVIEAGWSTSTSAVEPLDFKIWARPVSDR